MAFIIEYLIHAELSLASYATLSVGFPAIDELKRNAVGRASVQAQFFAERYTVLAQYNGEVVRDYVDEFGHPQQFTDQTGLSATLFSDVTGNRFVAIRGTQMGDGNDLITDLASIVTLGTTRFQAQYAALKARIDQWLTDPAMLQGKNFTVAGHSLGGFLAGGLMMDMGSRIDHAYLYNAPGVGGVGDVAGYLARVGEYLGIANRSADATRISNIVGSEGLSLVAGIGSPLSPQVTIQMEAQANPLDNHSVVVLTDALAVHDLLARTDSTVSIDAIGGLVKAASNKYADTLEALTGALGGVLLGTPTAIAPGDRDGLYQAIHNIRRLLDSGPQPPRTFVPLTEVSAADLATAAANPDGIATRYALKELNPFALLGANYGRFNAAGELDLYDPATGRGALSTDWIADRAGLLAAVLARNVADRTDPLIDGDTAYKDLALGLALGPNSLPQVAVIFGSAAGESMAFTHTRGDRVHLYGMAGNDSLLGGASADLLEGGVGDDQLRGGKGDDALLGGPGQDQLRGGRGADLLDGGADGDRLHGGDGNDDYRIGRNSGIDVITDFADEGALSPLLALFSNRDEEGDGQGRIRYAGTLMEGSLTADPADGQTWTGFGLIFRFNGTPGKRGLLTITDPAGEAGHEIKVMAWKSGELGLTLGERPAIAKTSLSGSAASDVLSATAPRQRVFGLAGDDRITVSLAEAEGWGGPGRDWISNGDGDQKLYGEEGDDVLIASAGDDELYGGADRVFVNNGDDWGGFQTRLSVKCRHWFHGEGSSANDGARRITA